MSARQPTAAERTVPIPGVDTRPRAAGPLVELEGPSVYRTTFGVPLVTHYRDGFLTLCGTPLAFIEHGRETHNQAVCQACRVEASRLRAVLR